MRAHHPVPRFKKLRVVIGSRRMAVPRTSKRKLDPPIVISTMLFSSEHLNYPQRCSYSLTRFSVTRSQENIVEAARDLPAP
jgi:hypothetical protein